MRDPSPRHRTSRGDGRRTLRRRAPAALLCAAAVALGSCGGASSPARPRPTFLDRPIGRSPVIAVSSAAMVKASLVPFVASANLADSDDWAIPVVHADAADPERTVALNPGGYGSRAPVRFRIPDWAQPSRGSDHHLAVLDGDRELDAWVTTRRPDGDLSAGARVVSDGDPVPGAIAATASGFALTAGLVTPAEVARGRIDHALAFTTPYTRSDFVAPAKHSDGPQHTADAMPMGTHIQLDPTVDVARLPRTQRVIATALQRYGAYLVDTGGSLALRAQSSLGAGPPPDRDAWAAAGVTDASLSTIPWDRMRVIAP